MDHKPMYTVGEIARLFKISVSTIHHYERKGLLSPEYINEQTGYRYYGYRQFEALNSIQYLRMLGLSLGEIGEFLENKNLSMIQERLAGQKEQIQKQIDHLERLKIRIDDRLERIRDAACRPLDTVFDELGPMLMVRSVECVLQTPCSEDLEMPIRVLSESQPEAVAWIGKIGLGISEERLIRKEFEQYDSVFLILDDSDELLGNETAVAPIRTLRIHFCGSHAEAAPAYAKLFDYMDRHHLSPAGFSREVTLIDQGLTDDLQSYVTEISIPVAEASD